MYVSLLFWVLSLTQYSFSLICCRGVSCWSFVIAGCWTAFEGWRFILLIVGVYLQVVTLGDCLVVLVFVDLLAV